MPVRAAARHWPFGLVLLGLVLVGLFWTFDVGAAWTRLVAWTVAMQRELHQGLATALRAVAESGPLAGLGLVGLSFLYGVFHAAGPGHGKVVIATYLGTQSETLRRGAALAFASAFLQGMVAIIAVAGTVLVLERTARQTQHLADQLERLSFAAVAILGCFLVWRAARGLLATQPAGCGHHHHGHEHGHGCGHHHAPAPGSSRAFGAALLSIGLRPCSGAILVLVLAFALDLRVAGVAAVLAMSLGTGMAVAGLATLTVYARDTASTLAGRLDEDGRKIARLGQALALLGGLVITALGLSLLQASFSAPAHPLF